MTRSLGFRSLVLTALIGAAILLPGCAGEYRVAEPPAAPKGDAAAAAKPAAVVQPAATQPAAARPGSGAVEPPTAQALSIQLSAGTALPQTGPEGTMMGFSVDYRFVQGQPTADGQYVWVIQRAKGAAAKQPARLLPQGTLQTFVQQWRPEDGPFQTHIEDAAGNRLSGSETMR